MSDQETQVSGEAPDQTSAQPSEETSKPTEDVENLKSQLNEYKTKVEQIQQFYTSYPGLVKIARKYADDPDVRTKLDTYLEGGSIEPNSDGASDSGVDLSSLDDTTKQAIAQLVDERVNSVRKEYDSKFGDLSAKQVQTQIDGWRKKYTKSAGFPVEFSEVENQIAEMLTRGEAVSAEGAYKQLALDYALKSSVEQEKQLKQAKLEASMSRGSLPQSMPTRGKDSTKSFKDAWMDALEQAQTKS